jgi:hypothetical protein
MGATMRSIGLLVLIFGACAVDPADENIASVEQAATAITCSGSTIVGSYCMDGVCDADENYTTCSQDCPTPAPTIRTADFDAQLYQNGAYDKPMVLIEGFDPADDYTVWNYRYPFTTVVKLPVCWNGMLMSPYVAKTRPPLLGTFITTAINKGYDVWVVSVRKQDTLLTEKTFWELGDAYRTTLHPSILSFAGYRPYVLSGFSAGGLIARKALAGMTSTARIAEVKAYVSIDTPHEGAYIPNAMQGYMLDHAVCGRDKPMGLDPQRLACHTRFVRYGLASKLALSVLRNQVTPDPGTYCSGWTFPSFWSDCGDGDGCTLPADLEWGHAEYSPYIGCWTHASWHVELRSADWFNANYGWFTDIPRYAISNSSIYQSTSMVHTTATEVLQVDVNNAGDHHLINDAQIYQPQKRGSLDGFINRMDGIHISGTGFWVIGNEADLIKKSSFVFVTYDSAFGRNAGLTWTGRLTGQNLPFDPYVIPDVSLPPTTTLHENLTQDTVDYIARVMDASLVGSTYPGDKGPYSALNNGTCGEGENVSNTRYDCLGTCGDGICNTSYHITTARESCSSCSRDCGICDLPCCGSCFAAGTPITMADGSEKPIEDVREGDTVLGRDDHGQILPQSVIGTVVHDNNDSTVIINGTLVTTREHPFYVAGRYVKAGDLQVGDELVMLDAATRAVPMATKPIHVRSLASEPALDRTYNFEVAGTHNYFAGGVLVHNKTACRTCDLQ